MISRTHKSFAWLWMVALLGASIGVSVQQVYCYCLGKTTFSFFAAEGACHARDIHGVTQIHLFNTTATDCCKKPSSEKKLCCEKPGAEKQDCTKRTTKVFQLKTEFEVGNTGFKKFDFPKEWAFLPAFLVNSPSFLGVQKLALPIFERPPPFLSGRTICVRHGVFRC